MFWIPEVRDTLRHSRDKLWEPLSANRALRDQALFLCAHRGKDHENPMEAHISVCELLGLLKASYLPKDTWASRFSRNHWFYWSEYLATKGFCYSDDNSWTPLYAQPIANTKWPWDLRDSGLGHLVSSEFQPDFETWSAIDFVDRSNSKNHGIDTPPLWTFFFAVINESLL